MKITRTEVTIHSVDELKGLLSTLEAGVLVFLDQLMDQEIPPEEENDYDPEFDDDLILNFDGILDA